jgi:MarR family transcriptional regulator, temperature-dependent positive regulator of motility
MSHMRRTALSGEMASAPAAVEEGGTGTGQPNPIKGILNGTTIPTAYKMGYVLNFYREPSFRAIEARLGITRPEIVTLIFLSYREGITASDICEFSGHLKPNVSRAVIALERKGLIRRAADGGDQRRQLLFLTEAGRRLHARFMPMLEARERAMLACLSTKEREQFERLLNKLSEHTPGWAPVDPEFTQSVPDR